MIRKEEDSSQSRVVIEPHNIVMGTTLREVCEWSAEV